MSKKKKFLGSFIVTTTFLGWLLLMFFQGLLSFLTGQFFKRLFSKKKKKEEEIESEVEVDIDPFDDLELENREDPFNDLELGEEIHE